MPIRKKYQALGRGLDALISMDEVKTEGSSSINEVDITQIRPNPDQPRRDFDTDSLQELASSIRQIGIVQPITLRDMGDGTYIIIAGERRWRASQLAGLTRIPAYIRTVDDENMMEMALVENIQRQDLTALEIALAYQHLIEQYGLTQEQLSDRVGKNRATVTNYLRLLKLPANIQMALKKREIDMGHARALLSLESPTLQLKLFKELLKNSYSVRKVEEMVQMLKQGEDVQGAKRKITTKTVMPAKISEAKARLTDLFQSKVQLSYSANGKGKISIPFSSDIELDRFVAALEKALSHKDNVEA